MQKWEYLWHYFYNAHNIKTIYTHWNNKKCVGYEQCDQALNEIGELGWEMCGVTSSFNSSGMDVQMIFKRPKS